MFVLYIKIYGTDRWFTAFKPNQVNSNHTNKLINPSR